jgi:hypothetical protein
VSVVEEEPVSRTPLPRRLALAVALGVALAVVGAFAAGVVVGRHHEPAGFLRVDRDVSGTVVKVGEGGAAVVIETDDGTESFQLLGDPPAPGDEVAGVVVELTTDGVSVEAVVLRPADRGSGAAAATSGR